jgi:hypothetical protein
MHIHKAVFKVAKGWVNEGQGDKILQLKSELSKATAYPAEAYSSLMVLSLVAETFETYVPLNWRIQTWKRIFVGGRFPVEDANIEKTIYEMLGAISVVLMNTPELKSLMSEIEIEAEQSAPN